VNKTAQSAKQQAEMVSAKHPARNHPSAGLEAQLGNRTTRALLGSISSNRGRQLDSAVRQKMEPAFGEDFSSVNVHQPESLPRGVQAATSGHHVVFGRGQYEPNTNRGQRLIAHELAHVVQQRNSTREGSNGSHHESGADRAADAVLAGTRPFVSTASTPALQFRIKPEDAASEMVGQTFEIIAPHTDGGVTLAVGDQVKVVTWDTDAAHSVRVTVLTGKAKGKSLIVPQRVLKPAAAAVAGIAPYSAGVESQARTVKKAEDDLAALQATKGGLKTKKEKQLFAAEESRQETLLTKRRNSLNRKEIQQQMFNRFDFAISNEVAAANAAHGLKGKDALDPNLVKAQLFQESEMGTAGEFMSAAPTHPVMTRFNLGQVIDSSAIALLTLMEREQTPLIAKFKLSHIRRDLAAAQNEKKMLEAKDPRSAAEESRLQALINKSHANWEAFIWQYVPPGETQGFADAVNELFAAGGAGSTPKNVDYVFWIHLAILWLFEKKKAGMSWPNAIKAYNGSGDAAEHYKLAIVKRAAGAATSQSAGSEFIPTR
jgi:hypothetical protein